MPNSSEDDTREYIVLVNDEEQYSIWLAYNEIPSGWTAVGPRGEKKDCLAWIGQNWTDMTPKSLRAAVRSGNADSSRAAAGVSEGPVSSCANTFDCI